MASDPRRAAQERADQIRAFRRELDALAREGASPLAPDQEAALSAYHEGLLARLARDVDVDRTDRSSRLARGLRLASFFGAATSVAAITALVSRVWGGLSLPVQVTLLALFPLAALAGVQAAAVRERSRPVASLFALVAVGTAWVALVMTARLLDLPFSSLLLWPGAGFGLAVAFSYGFRLVLAMSLAALVVAVAAGFFAAGGVPWTQVFVRVEPLTVAAFVLTVLARRLGAAAAGLEDAARVTGLALGLGGLLGLSAFGDASLLPVSASTARHLYQGAMLIASVGVLAWRLRAGDQAGVALSSAYLGGFLLLRYVDWFWDAVPAWAFFLILAGAAFAGIAALERLRRRPEGA